MTTFPSSPKERAKHALNQWSVYRALSAVERKVIEGIVAMAIASAQHDVLVTEEDEPVDDPD